MVTSAVLNFIPRITHHPLMTQETAIKVVGKVAEYARYFFAAMFALIFAISLIGTAAQYFLPRNPRPIPAPPAPRAPVAQLPPPPVPIVLDSRNLQVISFLRQFPPGQANPLSGAFVAFNPNIEFAQFQMENGYENSPIQLIPADAWGEIHSHLPPQGSRALGQTCQRLRQITLTTWLRQNTLTEQAIIADFYNKRQINVAETRFRSIEQFSRVQLCEILYRKFNVEGYEAVEKGHGLIGYMIRNMGPFTFLSIPCVSLESDPIYPIERGRLADGRIFVRFTVQKQGTEEKRVQVIGEEPSPSRNWVTMGDRGIWPPNTPLGERHIYQIISFFNQMPWRSETGIVLPDNLSHRYNMVPYTLTTLPSS